MNLADLSIRRPIFITCVVIVMIALGLLCMKRLGVDLFPSVTFPVVTVTTAYPGAGPSEIETLVSRPLEEEVSSISGIKRLSSRSSEGVSQVVAEFTLETDVKFAEQQIRDRVGSAKRKLPLDIREPVIRRIDPSDQPVVVYSISAPGAIADAQLYDIADEIVRPRLEQVSKVGLVEIIGGRKREIQVQLDRNKLKSREIPVIAVAQRLGNAGENVPVGKSKDASKETVFRSLGEFKTLPDISKTLVSFYGSDVPSTVSDIGKIVDTLEDETSRAYVNGKKAILLFIFRQSGANTISVVDDVNKAVRKINDDFKLLYKESGNVPELVMIRDTSNWIRANVTDVTESILIGIILAVTVVFLFLTNFRSTIITGLALPNSLIGAFVLMFWAGFSINIMTLLALSLSVGLLIDDAIVVRENIFRHIERGAKPLEAALKGTDEVRLAVIATTLTVLAVFGPVGFLKGVTGQFFREFGLTICFAMLISLFDALTIAPMLSAYFAVEAHKAESELNFMDRLLAPLYRALNRMHERLEAFYERTLRWILRHPLKALAGSFLIFLGSCGTLKFVPKTFLPPQDAGEFAVGIELPSGASLEAMAKVAQEVDQVIRKNSEVRVTSLTVGGRNGQSNVAEFYVSLIPAKQRSMNTTQVKAKIREQLIPFAHTKPAVKDYDAVGGGMRPFALSIIGPELKQVEEFSAKVYERLRKHPSLLDVDTSSKEGKPEFQIIPIAERAQNLGILSRSMGEELRAQMEGVVAAKFREQGREYDVRVRLLDDQRDLRSSFQSTYVPNVNGNLVRLGDFSTSQETIGPSTINRMDRGRTVQIQADITPGKGMGEVMTDIRSWFETDLKLPAGFKYTFIGQAENFEELGSSMATAMGLGILFIFLVLASLYESFVTPLTIMLALPLALCGSFVALAITQQSLNIFSMIGAIMLLGVATKNSILLVDYANQEVSKGVDRTTAMIAAGKTRLRPILMTSLALIAGSIPIALGLNEASRQRTSMGVAIVGGMVSSTLLTLIVIPAAYSYIDRFRLWSQGVMKRLVYGRKSAHGDR